MRKHAILWTAMPGHDAEGMACTSVQHAIIQIQLSNSGASPAWQLLSNSHASSPVLFGEAPGRPVFPLSPLKDEGDGAPRGATIVLDVPAFPLGNTGRRSARHPDKLAHVRIYLRASSLRRRAALFVAARETRDGLRQPSSWRAAPIGRQAEPRRRPGACLAGHARGRRIRSHPA